MATVHSLIFPTIRFMKFILLFHWFCFLGSLADKSHGLEGRQVTTEGHFHTLQLSSLSLHSVCKPFSGSRKGPSTLEVINRYGPCSSTTGQDTAIAPSLSEILTHDEFRVQSIQALVIPDSVTEGADIPARSGEFRNSGNYVISLGLGTPKKSLSLAFDTGSSLLWTQCQPCAQSCYKQTDPIFDPSASTTYFNVSCNSPKCSLIANATSEPPGCTGTTCFYTIMYGDRSYTQGLLSEDTLTLTPTDVFKTFMFGCGQNNDGLFGSIAGILGLGKDPSSIVFQTAQKYNKYFSYCLPSTPSSTGHLTFGNTATSSSNIKFTTFLNSPLATSLYFIGIEGIRVGGKQLPIDKSVFSDLGSIIDSGTVITRLPPSAYSELRAAFQQLMTNYPRAPSYHGILDTCYDFKDYATKNVTIPKISFLFHGDVEVNVPASGILLTVNGTTSCLPFIPNQEDQSLTIFGNTQQKTLEVVYDVAGGKLGFGDSGCD